MVLINPPDSHLLFPPFSASPNPCVLPEFFTSAFVAFRFRVETEIPPFPFLLLCRGSCLWFPLLGSDLSSQVKTRIFSVCQSAITMELYAKSVVSGPTNVIYLSTILDRDGGFLAHKCDWKCENERVCGNMYRCKLTGITHICDKNCNQRIVYDNHSSLCRASGQIFPLTPTEEQAVRGIRRKLDAENSPNEGCASKRKRDAMFNPSPFERSIFAVSPICSRAGDAMDMS